MANFMEVRAQFSSAHFYSQPLWSPEKNRTEFGRCFTPYGHGHNYQLVVFFSIPPEVSDLSELEAWEGRLPLAEAVQSEVQALDHEHLNFVIPEFEQKIPTTENIAVFLMERLQARQLAWPPVRLRLYEMDDLWVEVEA